MSFCVQGLKLWRKRKTKFRFIGTLNRFLKANHLMLDKMISSADMSKSLVFQYMVLIKYSKVQYSMQILSSRETLNFRFGKWKNVKHRKRTKK